MSGDMDRPVPRSRWRRRRLGYGVVAVLALGVVGYLTASGLGLTQRTLRVAAASVTVDTVETGVFRDLTPLRGRVVPHDIIYLDADEGGGRGAVACLVV